MNELRIRSNEDCSSNSNSLAFIDALRGMAAIYVVICHVGFIPSPALALQGLGMRFVHAGHTGVILFFLVSSLTLCLSSSARKNENNHILKFYLRRLFRILPLFYFSLLLACIRDYILRGTILPPSTVMSSFIGIFQPGRVDNMVWASWTLGIELCFYLIFPVVFIFAHNLRRALFILLVAIFLDLTISHSVIKSISSSVNDTIIRFSMIHNLPFFLFGIVIFLLYQKQQGLGLSGRVIGYLTILLSLSIFTGLLVWHPTAFTSLADIGHYLITSYMLLLIVGLAMHPTRLIINAITCYYGKISYSLYLLHPPVIWFLIPIFRLVYLHNWPDWLCFCLCVILTLLIVVPSASLTYTLVEVPGIQLGKTVIKRWL